MRQNLKQYETQKKLTTLVENRTTYQADFAELNVFETQKVSEKVSLTFGFPVIASMLKGKKVMHLEGMPSFEFVPGQSVVMPTDQEMVIDFPVATEEEPTQCLALGIDKSKIQDVVMHYNESVQIENENNSWAIDDTSAHLLHNGELNMLIDRLIQTFTNPNRKEDVLLDLMIQELVVRLLQTKAKTVMLSSSIMSDSRLGSVIKYIKDNLTSKNLTVDELAQKAYMSSSHFHKKFKNTLGVSPIDYINAEKIKFAKKLMSRENSISVSEVALLSGFTSSSYFHRQFKKYEMITPQQFRKSLRS